MKQKMSKFTPAMKQICIFVTVNSRPLECAFTPNNQHINI